eukprot:GEMP01043070.1.p1 GENE.GEMP01043070.1~~GEMP01043070.1.p1  ORF type:complete len:256 (-),score=54.40 GEMP01043070.1:717-1484(-)
MCPYLASIVRRICASEQCVALRNFFFRRRQQRRPPRWSRTRFADGTQEVDDDQFLSREPASQISVAPSHERKIAQKSHQSLPDPALSSHLQGDITSSLRSLPASRPFPVSPLLFPSRVLKSPTRSPMQTPVRSPRIPQRHQTWDSPAIEMVTRPQVWDVVSLQKKEYVGKVVKKSKIEYHFRVMIGDGRAPVTREVVVTWSTNSRTLRVFVRDVKVLEVIVQQLDDLGATFMLGLYRMRIFSVDGEFQIALAEKR